MTEATIYNYNLQQKNVLYNLNTTTHPDNREPRIFNIKNNLDKLELHEHGYNLKTANYIDVLNYYGKIRNADDKIFIGKWNNYNLKKKDISKIVPYLADPNVKENVLGYINSLTQKETQEAYDTIGINNRNFLKKDQIRIQDARERFISPMVKIVQNKNKQKEIQKKETETMTDIPITISLEDRYKLENEAIEQYKEMEKIRKKEKREQKKEIKQTEDLEIKKLILKYEKKDNVKLNKKNIKVKNTLTNEEKKQIVYDILDNNTNECGKSYLKTYKHIRETTDNKKMISRDDVKYYYTLYKKDHLINNVKVPNNFNNHINKIVKTNFEELKQTLTSTIKDEITKDFKQDILNSIEKIKKSEPQQEIKKQVSFKEQPQQQQQLFNPLQNLKIRSRNRGISYIKNF